MLREKIPQESDYVTHARIEKELAKPRMAKSARIAELKLDTGRSPEQPSTTMSGTVERIIPSRRTSQSEKAQIAVDGDTHRHCNLRIENAFTDENGDELRLKKGARVEITVTAKVVTRRK